MLPDQQSDSAGIRIGAVATCQLFIMNLAKGPLRVVRQIRVERALVYKTLVLTGLRKAELASLTAGHVNVETDPSFLVLDAGSEKKREGSTLQMRKDLADDLRGWMSDKGRQPSMVPTIDIDRRRHHPQRSNRGDANGDQQSANRKLTFSSAAEPLFSVPTGLVRILNRDLQAAGIAKTDERGRTLDVHSLRHTFATLLSKGGVAPRTAQAALRHSTVELTMNTYTDPKLFDVLGALDALPELRLDVEPVQSSLKATGTDAVPNRTVAPTVAPTSGNRSKLLTLADQRVARRASAKTTAQGDASCCPLNENNPLTSAVNGLREVERRGVEPPTSALRTQRSPN